MLNGKPSKRMILRITATALPLAALVVLYAVWLFSRTHATVYGIVMSAVIVFLFAVLGIRFIPQWIGAWSGVSLPPVELPGKRSARHSRMHPTVQILLMLLLSRVVLFLVAYLLISLRDGYQGGLLDRLSIWNPVSLDSRHYLSIAENGYVIAGDERLKLVFFPFYPILIKLVSFLTQNYFAAGLIVSNLCFILAGWVLYELTLLDHSRETALRTVKYFCLLPASLLFSAPMSDSVFLLACVSCLYLTRKKHYLPASLIGGLAAFTRLPGLILLAPVCFELVADTVTACSGGGITAKRVLRRTGQYASLLLIPAGFALYLYLNYKLTGNAFTFLSYQQENWHQGLGWFFSTGEYQLNYAVEAIADGEIRTFLGLWLPNLCCLVLCLPVVTLAQRQLRPSYVAYFIAYYAVTMGATWLLSAPRYLTACFPLLMSLGVLTRRRRIDIPLSVVLALLQVCYLWAFLNRWQVY